MTLCYWVVYQVRRQWFFFANWAKRRLGSRSEQDVFRELSALCASKGFIHAIAWICYRDNVIRIRGDEMSIEDLQPAYSMSRLNRYEISTLIGLMMRSSVDFTLPKSWRMQEYIDRSDYLMREMHQQLLDISTAGSRVREAAFYGMESAYYYQLYDLAPEKYAQDTDWLLKNRGIDLEVGRDICRVCIKSLNENLPELMSNLRETPFDKWTFLPGVVVSCKKVASDTGHPYDKVKAFFDAFTFPETDRNERFSSLSEFNSAYEYPFIRKSTDEYVLFQIMGLTEAFYEAPYYWMREDQTYRDELARHRGEFTETFAFRRLESVFGRHVYKNVQIEDSRGNTLGEIDVLVIYGNHAIVLQAKSKRFTIESRKGNDRLIQRDFRSAVQKAVDQAGSCGNLLLNDCSIILRSEGGVIIPLTDSIDSIFSIAVVSDHYPALAHQVHEFLRFSVYDGISDPLVTDIFTLDIFAEFLDSPLRLLNYLRLRSRIGNRLYTNHEVTALAAHLKNNLWFEDDIDGVLLSDDICSHIDVAMSVRRCNTTGSDTPEGILTWFQGSNFERLISHIQHKPYPAAIETWFVFA